MQALINRRQVQVVTIIKRGPVTISRAIIGAVILGGVVMLFLINPAQSSFFPPCPFHELTGLDCPGCGSTRGLHALLHGRLLSAMDYNPLLLPGLVAVTANAWHAWSGRGARIWAFFNHPRIVLSIVCAFWVLRNIPVYPFRLLSAGY